MDGLYTIYCLLCFCGLWHSVCGVYVGCYELNSNFYKEYFSDPSGGCQNACSVRGRTYYVLKTIAECRCADTLPRLTTHLKGCTYSCDGIECGGPNSLSIHTVCDRGRWGYSCQYQCHCADNQICNKRDGLCPSGCAPGWYGTACDRASCPIGSYLSDCTGRCHCADNEQCDTGSGFCSNGCATGWSGVTCNQCDVGYYGDSCDQQCHCVNNDPCPSGICNNGCAVGWEGTSCNTEACETGKWGETCDGLCHCSNGDACSKDYGTCPNGCATGWSGVTCNQCDEGYYGDSCHLQCYCMNGDPCPSGICPNGCTVGWTGLACNTEGCETGRWGETCDQQCHCRDGAACQRDNGFCSNGCTTGWRGSACNVEACDPGKYGPGCGDRSPYQEVGCFSSEILLGITDKSLDGSSNETISCREMCLKEYSNLFSILMINDEVVKCYCNRELPSEHKQTCPSSRSLRALLAVDSVVILYTVCPPGSYSTDGVSCDQYCNCPIDSTQSGLCVYDSASSNKECVQCTGGWQGALCVQDINECDSDHGCEAGCTNTQGSYYCTCPDGSLLAEDQRSCTTSTFPATSPVLSVNPGTSDSNDPKISLIATVVPSVVIFVVLSIIIAVLVVILLRRKRQDNQQATAEHTVPYYVNKSMQERGNDKKQRDGLEYEEVGLQDLGLNQKQNNHPVYVNTGLVVTHGVDVGDNGTDPYEKLEPDDVQESVPSVYQSIKK